MAVISTSRVIFYAFAALCVAVFVSCRPQTAIDSQDNIAPEQDSSSEIRRLYNAYNSYPNNGIMPVGGWSDPLYRSPEIKRQVRYRQCYFNPISCFRK
uniref:Gustatory receptor 4 n=1 Tax=Propsilocerus akamusi TaxID=903466 RepID=A0A7D0P9P9_9DIPT|nr:gustatory receptor 4 [Propsilocerus akamusi]